MKWKEVINLNEQLIEKFKDNPDFIEQVKNIRKQTNRIRLLSPIRLNSDLSKKDEKIAIKQFSKLGIHYVKPIVTNEKILNEMNRIAREVMRGR